MLIDKQKFVEWIDRHHASLFKHALWMTANRSLAEELVQETFYQAWKSRNSIGTADNPLPWLLTVLRRAVYREYQHARIEATTLFEQPIETGGSTDEDFDALVDLSSGLMSLSARQREMLLLYSLHGFTYEQIAEQLNIPIGTVMSRIARARDALRAFFAPQNTPGVVVAFRRRNKR